ncbi:MAG: response regulator transcription factor [Treponema sp.]|nr:response regulator transcription factor [Treponema sp.]
MEKQKVLLVDDQSLFTESLKTFLTNYAHDIEVVGSCQNGKESCEFVKKNPVDVILMDVKMPVMNGVEAVKIIKKSNPLIKIIMLSTYDEDDFVRNAIMSGASGYLLKDLSPTELIISIRALKSGVMQISPSLAEKLIMKKYVEVSDTVEKSENEIIKSAEKKLEWMKTLTKREREIFALIATGHDNSEISAELSLAIQTVKNQVSTIYSKLGVKDRFEIIKLANQV